MQPKCGIYISRQESSQVFFWGGGQMRKEKKKRNWYCIQTHAECQCFQVNEETHVKNINHYRSVNTGPTNSEMEYFGGFVCLFYNHLIRVFTLQRRQCPNHTGSSTLKKNPKFPKPALGTRHNQGPGNHPMASPGCSWWISEKGVPNAGGLEYLDPNLSSSCLRK